MTTALVTFGVGTHAELLDLSRPTFEAYAQRHGYDYIEAQEIDASRPPSWSKVPLLLSALETHDAALWIDCDCVIVDGSVDINSVVPSHAWQAQVAHHTLQGEVPSCGVWYVRKPMIPVLEQIWGMEQFIGHYWWEQAAMHTLLGYKVGGWNVFPISRIEETELYDKTHFLPLAWNSDINNDPADYPYFVHVPGEPLPRRKQIMQKLLSQMEVVE